jgi:hypothetical protein
LTVGDDTVGSDLAPLKAFRPVWILQYVTMSGRISPPQWTHTRPRCTLPYANIVSPISFLSRYAIGQSAQISNEDSVRESRSHSGWKTSDRSSPDDTYRRSMRYARLRHGYGDWHLICAARAKPESVQHTSMTCPLL